MEARQQFMLFQTNQEVKLNFKDKVINDLGRYRIETLGIQDAGVFSYKRQELLKEHILPIQFKKHNIIQNYRDSFYASSTSEIDFHKYFHHLNSSQALCINLFFPLIAEGKLSLILRMLSIPEQAIEEATFEKESDLEVGEGRKTNFDFYMRLADDTKIYFEIKYTESEFGKAKNDSSHRGKFDKTYLPLLKGNDYINPDYHEVDKFLDSYQIMRNLCHISENSYVVFVYPKENKKIHSQAQSAQAQILTDKGSNRLKIMDLDTAIDEVLKQVQITNLADHYSEFKNKYLKYTSAIN